MASSKAGAAFSRKVHAFVRKVPKGRVTTYGDVAYSIGQPGAARAVGHVMRNTPDDSPTPCHRVVRAGGHVVPVRGNALVARLRAEGVTVKSGQVVGFARLRWP
ncbi:MAG: MGMT family protein [bacterium]